MLLDGLISTWLLNREYTVVTWTLYVELWGSLIVYAFAFTAAQYRQRYTLYILAIVFVWVPLITDSLKITKILGK